jgi:hypothetical protein
LSGYLVEHLAAAPHRLRPPDPGGDPLAGDDFHLGLYILNELSYRSFPEVSDAWEWHADVLRTRAGLTREFEQALTLAVGGPEPVAPEAVAAAVVEAVARDDGPSLSRHLLRRGTLAQFREFLVHRSAYHLKEADPHTFAIPRLHGVPKAALVEIQADEYGGGREPWMHSALFRRSMEALGLDGTYGAYLDLLPGTTLATVNLMSTFGFQRRWRGAIAGHLAVLEMTSSEPMRRYAGALRRLGFDGPATAFFDEHVEADAVHEQVAAHDLAGGLARQEPGLAGDILFGARCVLHLEARFAERLLRAWAEGASALRRGIPDLVSAA